MKRIAVRVSIIIWGALFLFSRQSLPVLAAGISSITIDYYPAGIATDASTPCSSGGGTPFAVRVTVNGNANQNFAIKVRLDTGACTWRADNSSWNADNTSYSELPRGTIGSGGSVSMWLYGRAKSTANASLTVSARGCDAIWSTCADTVQSAEKTVTLLNMTTSGGWLEETGAPSRSGRAIVVKSGASIVGLYVIEENNVSEGYNYSPGGYKVAVPTCTSCNYTTETWNLDSPGTAVGRINTMGQGTCPNSVTAGATTSLNTCAAPTAVKLSSFSAQSDAAVVSGVPGWVGVPVAALLLAGAGVWLARRR